MNHLYKEFLISDDKSLINMDTVCEFLSRSHWANQRPVETIHKSIQNSFCFGIYDNKRQVGFARIVTDWATIYYLCDVFIDEEYRGRGLGKKLVELIAKEFEGIGGILRTHDAHELYEQYGFIRDTERFMNRLLKR
ncbi:GNAT family N-acetyltransferase [Paenibacillus sp. MCAF9]|uniref:GNAT family N-acetyltransferase n=1 Tax=unclassified Paenibacillus TaxID=185978 RepID=UPI003F97EE57